MVLLEEAVELAFIALHILEYELLEPLVAELQRLLLDRVEVVDPDDRERERPVLLLQVLLRVLLNLQHQRLALLLAVGREVDVSDEVLDDLVAVLLEVHDLLGVDLELADVLVEAEEVLAGALEAESPVVVGEGISNLLDVVLVREEVDQLLINYQRFLEVILKQHSLSLDQLRSRLDDLLVVVAERGVE